MNATPPIVVHIPHSSTSIPPEERSRILLSECELQRELLAMTDWFIDELFGAPGYLRQVNQVSRLVMDPERFRDDATEEMSKHGMGAIYSHTSAGALLRDLSTEQREALLVKYYDPYHAMFAELVEGQLRRCDRCLIIDAHSFPSKPLPHEQDKVLPRPEICIGFDDFHCGLDLPQISADYFQKAGLTVEYNRPFAGSIVPHRFYQRDARFSSIMIEINRSVYMNETTGVKLSRFAELQRLVTGYLRQMAEHSTR